jgi:peptidoglycan hydrolase-like protein with peptidoglycan-binding domain
MWLQVWRKVRSPKLAAIRMDFTGAACPLHSDGLTAAARHVGVDPTALWTVVVVETSGCGFLPDRRPCILFERHIFSTRTGRHFDAAHPGISGYGQPGAHQYERLEEAIACDRHAATESASWGLGQIMGFNAGFAGFRDAKEMVSEMIRSENEQIFAMASFIRATGMHAALQRRDWTDFARRYNGLGFATNRYHEKLAAAHTSLSNKGLPDLEVRAVQLILTYHGFNPSKSDGVVGGLTRAAIAAFTSKHKLPAAEDHKDLQAALLGLLPAITDGQGARPSATPAPPRAAPDLRVVQSLLEYLDWNPGPVDGRPGPRTRNAIAGFQRSYGATATVVVDGELQAALAAEAKRGFGLNSVADTRLVQRLLVIKGFYPGDIDGLVGPRMRAAITAFVQVQGPSPTDAVDAGLLGALLAPDDYNAESGARA